MTVVMVAPALVKVGLPMHVAHMLAFYFAVLSEVSPPVGLSPSAAAAVTGGNPFASMMQAWKYSLPAFLVPFLFAASKEGAALLLVDATLGDFLLALVNSSACLFFLSVGIVGYLRGRLSPIERGVLIVAACFMTFDPIDLSVSGVAPMLTASLLVVWHLYRTRRRPAGGAPVHP
jgi:TRAP-type uncharacterized transport system fused permease subunit